MLVTIKLSASYDLKEIKSALQSMLYVPDVRLKPLIIDRLLAYLKAKFQDTSYKIRPIIAYQGIEIIGFVIAMIHPTYRSYSRKCGTFGWLSVHDFDTCKALMKECETFMRENKVRKIRGNVNFPKGLGGLGIQSEGFDRPMLYGVAFCDNPEVDIISFLKKLGYIAESEYICMEVTEKSWDAGRRVAKDIRLGYYTIEEFWEHEEEFHDLIAQSFQGMLPMPDTSGHYRYGEIIRTYEAIPKSHFGVNTVENFDPKTYSKIPEFQEAWENCDLDKAVMGAPLAFDRSSGKLVGAILAIADIFQGWLDQLITQMNVDTVMVNKNYAGKGIFSALNNIGQLGTGLNGITYFEGTTIWNNNPDAIKAIFPHGKPVKKHYVMQKRIKSN